MRRFLERIIDWFIEPPGDGMEVFEEREYEHRRLLDHVRLSEERRKSTPPPT
jgi:hypothetical protein